MRSSDCGMRNQVASYRLSVASCRNAELGLWNRDYGKRFPDPDPSPLFPTLNIEPFPHSAFPLTLDTGHSTLDS